MPCSFVLLKDFECTLMYFDILFFSGSLYLYISCYKIVIKFSVVMLEIPNFLLNVRFTPRALHPGLVRKYEGIRRQKFFLPNMDILYTNRKEILR